MTPEDDRNELIEQRNQLNALLNEHRRLITRLEGELEISRIVISAMAAKIAALERGVK